LLQVKDVFDADPKSTFELLCTNGQGLYVPAYQREYSWDKDNVKRLIDDAMHGLAFLVGHEDSITFIGTIIAIHDTDFKTVQPIVRREVPPRVMSIIDGQQRLSTLLVLNVVLHETIKARLRRIARSTDAVDVWLAEVCQSTIASVQKTFEEDMQHGEESCRWYPRMIRAYVDQWSKKAEQAQYTSPIAKFVHEYGIHDRAGRGVYTYAVPEGDPREDDHVHLKKIQGLVKRLIKKNVAEGTGDMEPIQCAACATSANIAKALFNEDAFPEAVQERLRATDDETGKWRELFRLVAFTNFELNRMGFTVVTAKNEDYAFDMFEALNTTGEPLTAFETFKPRVIAAEGLGEYKGSDSYTHVEKIEAFLSKYDKSKKQAGTSDLLIPFKLAESGEKLSKRLSEQRRILRSDYEKLPAIDEQRAYLRHIAHASTFSESVWSPFDRTADPDIHVLEDDREDCQLCLDLLKQAKHTITMAPIMRYWSAVRLATGEERQAAKRELAAAIKAITAFSVIWRFANTGTAGIDAIYRKILREGYGAVGLHALARRPNGETLQVPETSTLKEALRHRLAEDRIATSAQWVDRAHELPAYTNQSQMTRFLLLAATHDTMPDEANPGLVKKTRPGTLDAFNYRKWRNDEWLSIEHVAPKTRPADGWREDLYGNPRSIHRIGNLVLLPAKVNASLGNKAWTVKKLIYRVLCARDEDEIERRLAETVAAGIEFPESTEEVIRNARFLPQVEAISEYGGEWTLEFIEERSKRILEIAWDRFAGWLGIDL